jgi:hypothetical protein
VADRVPLPPRRAAAARRAAALFVHWRRKESGVAGEMAVLTEIETGDLEAWTDLVCALLNVGSEMAHAARHGREDAYLEYVIREAALDEVIPGA